MAEEIDCENCAQTPELLAELSPEAAWQIIHELRVHQIELEIQNEELRRTQEELQAARARYFDLFDLAPVAYLTISDKGLIQETNLTFSTRMGVARKTLLKKPFSRFIYSEDQDIYYLRVKALFETGAVQDCELRLVSTDGAIVWMKAEMALTQETDGASGMRVTLSDIGERKRLSKLADEQAVAVIEKELLYRTVLEQSPEAVLLIDPGTGEIVEANTRFTERFGYKLPQQGPLGRVSEKYPRVAG